VSGRRWWTRARRTTSRLARVQGADGAGEEGPVHEDLRGEHVGQAPGVLLHNLRVVFAREVVDLDLEPPGGVVFEHIARAACSFVGQTRIRLQLRALPLCSTTHICPK
jgi:hypothetical protein